MTEKTNELKRRMFLKQGLPGWPPSAPSPAPSRPRPSAPAPSGPGRRQADRPDAGPDRAQDPGRQHGRHERRQPGRRPGRPGDRHRHPRYGPRLPARPERADDRAGRQGPAPRFLHDRHQGPRPEPGQVAPGAPGRGPPEGLPGHVRPEPPAPRPRPRRDPLPAQQLGRRARPEPGHDGSAPKVKKAGKARFIGITTHATSRPSSGRPSQPRSTTSS